MVLKYEFHSFVHRDSIEVHVHVLAQFDFSTGILYSTVSLVIWTFFLLSLFSVVVELLKSQFKMAPRTECQEAQKVISCKSQEKPHLGGDT